MDPEGSRQPPRGQISSDPTTSSLGDQHVVPGGKAAQLQTSTEKQVPNTPLDAHLGLSHTQSGHFEPMSTKKHAHGDDGHGRKCMWFGCGPSAVPLDEPSIEWIKNKGDLTIYERLQPTIKNAIEEKNKYARKVLWTNWALNIMIALQVLLGALTTAISASVKTVRQAQVATAILGGLSTMVASYLARARGSGEPDLSILRVKDLEQFLRTAKAFQMDHGHEHPDSKNRLGEEVEHLRHRFEELLGNASGARKLSPVGITTTKTEPGLPAKDGMLHTQTPQSDSNV